MQDYQQRLTQYIHEGMGKDSINRLYEAVSHAAMEEIKPFYPTKAQNKTACYFSLEFLIGRVVYANLYNLGLLDDMRRVFEENGLDPNIFESVEDAALGNGGLGRLAACFLDSGATCGYALDGYGIRYKYGLFRQRILDGFQKEEADDWQRFGDPWSARNEDERVQVNFKGQSVWAVPYDMPIIGYGGRQVNTLRLWQAEPVRAFDFDGFNRQDYEDAFSGQNEAEAISAMLYPNDNTAAGKRLRLKQQYFFSAASLHSIIRQYKARFGNDLTGLPRHFAIQLNDTHPTVAIPELLRLLISGEGMEFETAFNIVRDIFAYTNHTIMAEALEKWEVDLFCDVIPEVYPYVVMLQNHLKSTLARLPIAPENSSGYYILENGFIHMVRMAVYATHSTNGVAALHTDILKNDLLKGWHTLYPERFNNKTNGITQRRWLGLCNPEYTRFITGRIGDGWLTNLDELQRLLPYADDPESLREFMAVKLEKKRQLAAYTRLHENGFELNCDSIFDIQVKRLHEYKRQLLNAFSIMDIYFSLRDGALRDFTPMTCIFGAKSAPGYRRAKGIIKYIDEIARMINHDPDTNDRLRVLFVQNYNVSYAEKLIPAADLSEQISTAGTEASGTGNMKLMLNGAVTLGTYDGANIEIVEESGEENNFIFGARVENIRALEGKYSPLKIYRENARIRRVLDTLVDGTFSDGGTGVFRELYDSILKGTSWHAPDQYYLLLDLEAYVQAKLDANRACADREGFARKCLLNTARAGKFSSDRTIRQYAEEIWGLSPTV